MTKYFIKRFLQLVVVAFIISVLVFLLVHLLPGDPSVTILGPNDTAHNRAILFKQLGLNKPLLQQYTTWLNAVFHGNLGQSYLNHESVTHIVATGAPIDIELIVISQVIAFAVAIPLALITSRRPNRAFDNVSTTTTFGLLALPPFVIAPIMVAVFAVSLHWFPATGYVPLTQDPATNLHDMILPSLAITAGSIAVYYRLLRSDLISTLQEDFITMARSKGLSNRRIMLRHAFRPSTFSLLAAAGGAARTGPPPPRMTPCPCPVPRASPIGGSCCATPSDPRRSLFWPRQESTSVPCWPAPSSGRSWSPPAA